MPLNTSYLLTYVAEVCGEEFNQLERADDRRRGFAAAEAGLVSTSQQTGHCCVAGAVFCCRRLACSVHTPTYPPPTPTPTHTHTHTPTTGGLGRRRLRRGLFARRPASLHVVLTDEPDTLSQTCCL